MEGARYVNLPVSDEKMEILLVMKRRQEKLTKLRLEISV